MSWMRDNARDQHRADQREADQGQTDTKAQDSMNAADSSDGSLVVTLILVYIGAWTAVLLWLSFRVVRWNPWVRSVEDRDLKQRVMREATARAYRHGELTSISSPWSCPVVLLSSFFRSLCRRDWVTWLLFSR